MNRTSPETSTTRPGGNNSPTIADMMARADRLAREMAAFAGSDIQRKVVHRIARNALDRAFDMEGGRS